MDWYFVENGQTGGPVSSEQLDHLVASGRITAETLIWTSGMTEWKPYRVTRGAGQPPQVIASCAICQEAQPKEEMIPWGQNWVCAKCKPVYVQMLREGVTPSGGTTAWRQGKLLVMDKTAPLPDRCIKCNEPAHGYRLKRKLYWHHPLIYLTIFLNILIYLIVAMIVRQRAKIEVGLCERHRRVRLLAILIGWFGLLGGIGLFILAAALDTFWLNFSGVALILGGAIYGMVVAPMVTAKKIDGTHVRLRGVCADYLNALPEWQE